jgi:hypothetical protein
MNTSPDRRAIKGIGRLSFIADLAEITAELDAGRSLKAVYERRRSRIGISYSQFARYADRFIRRSARDQTASPPSTAAPPPHVESAAPVGITASDQASHTAPRARRIFSYDPVERPDDRRRLLGED